MFKAEFSWNDVGSWSSVYEMNEKDSLGNVSRGRTIAIDARNSLIFSCGKKPLAVIGLERVAVIDTANGILVAPIDKLQQVKRVIDMLKKGKSPPVAVRLKEKEKRQQDKEPDDPLAAGRHLAVLPAPQPVHGRRQEKQRQRHGQHPGPEIGGFNVKKD